MEEREIEYQELFERSGYRTIEEVREKIRAVLDEHTEDLGWVAGEPQISLSEDGTYKVAIPLVKYAVNKGYSR